MPHTSLFAVPALCLASALAAQDTSCADLSLLTASQGKGTLSLLDDSDDFLRHDIGFSNLDLSLQIEVQDRLGKGPCTLVLHSEAGEAARRALHPGESLSATVDNHVVTATLLECQETIRAAAPDAMTVVVHARTADCTDLPDQMELSLVGAPHVREREEIVTLQAGEVREIVMPYAPFKEVRLPDPDRLVAATGLDAEDLRERAQRRLTNEQGFAMGDLIQLSRSIRLKADTCRTWRLRMTEEVQDGYMVTVGSGGIETVRFELITDRELEPEPDC